jgi:hypothetical protein
MFDFIWLHEYKPEHHEWLIEGLICPSLTVLSGQAKAGKSTFAGHLVSSLIQGTEILGKIPNMQGIKVCWMGTDGGWINEVHQRLQGKVSENLVLSAMLPVDIKTWEDFGEQLVSMGIKLLVVDHLAGLSGEHEIDSQNEATKVLSCLKPIHEKHGIAVLLLAHSPRGANGGRVAHSYVTEATARVLLQLEGQTSIKDLQIRGNEIESKKFVINLTQDSVAFTEKVKKERKSRDKAVPKKVREALKLSTPEDILNQSSLARALVRWKMALSEAGARQQVITWIKKGLVTKNADGTISAGPNLAFDIDRAAA